LLARLQKAAAAAGRRWVQIELLALQTVAHAHRGARTNAQETLLQALRLGVGEGYIRSFVMVGADLRTLLLEAQMQVSEPRLRSYIATILAAFPPAHSRSEEAVGDSLPAHSDHFEALSDRELEVLRLVASGYSDRQIADALVVVVGTAKRHLNNIYGKLLVHSRTQALARARQLGLLE
jgi:LuxR family maltose regulon positive regulatory protein